MVSTSIGSERQRDNRKRSFSSYLWIGLFGFAFLILADLVAWAQAPHLFVSDWREPAPQTMESMRAVCGSPLQVQHEGGDDAYVRCSRPMLLAWPSPAWRVPASLVGLGSAE